MFSARLIRFVFIIGVAALSACTLPPPAGTSAGSASSSGEAATARPILPSARILPKPADAQCRAKAWRQHGGQPVYKFRYQYPYIQRPKTLAIENFRGRGSKDLAVDAETVPAVVLPRDWFAQGGTGVIGDFALLWHMPSGRYVPALVAGVREGGSLAQLSPAAANMLGGAPLEAVDMQSLAGELAVLVFPYSNKEFVWPQPLSAMYVSAETLLGRIGGSKQLRACTRLLQPLAG